MKYCSTRGHGELVESAQAILSGIAPDGGLYVPTEFPKIDLAFDWLMTAPYQEVAQKILTPFLSDFTESELLECIEEAYNAMSFDTISIAPVVKYGQTDYLELFHGPTLAFKDMALSILPYFMTTAIKKLNVDKEIIILTATSGDTGKAAMEGFADVAGTKIIVFYPKYGVSSIQEKQMLTQTGDNTFVVGITGNFDDAQLQVKQIFNDEIINEQLSQHGKQFSSANSINIGRLLPQVVYYVYAYGQLLKSGRLEPGDLMNVSVPTGNFGNILAAYYAKQIGLPIGRLICASNKNNVLTDFFMEGIYDKNREFYVTNSPSMDILISSNLERLLWHVSNQDSKLITDLMQKLRQTGCYEISNDLKNKISQDFYGGFANERLIERTIKETFYDDQLVIDPHTAVAKAIAEQYAYVTDDDASMLVVSTASPFKFPQAILNAVGKYPNNMTDSELLESIGRIMDQDYPKGIQDMLLNPMCHHLVIDPEEMVDTVLNLIKK
ncbi:threonine synthase [Vagococcus vulneris]|uniref:Threonine synthase n=1 Tax=Vagococcus vulneris TaxID=1977869 RepID=A0A429ZY18_9ENTE|nr:threonine synthase [Vagococcus vulneris]RST98794.1 threonine synthase [Vagococcus vulneris]